MRSQSGALRRGSERVALRTVAAIVIAALIGVAATPASAGAPEKVPRAVPIELPRPEYPPSHRADGVAGSITVRLDIGPDGRVTNAEPIDGPKSLWAAVVPAASLSIFECRGCGADGARYLVVYEFKLETKARTEATQPAPTFNATSARVTVIGEGRRVVPNHVPREEVRALRCLWLWPCGVRPIY